MIHPDSDLQIRKATVEDVPLILDFIRSIAAFERLADQVTADEATLRNSLFGAHPAAEVSLAFVGGQAAAYAVYFHNFSTFEGRRGMYLEDIFVRPDYRGTGVGKGLLKHVAQIARDRDCARFEWVVLDWNQRAIDFYKSLGSQVLEEWRLCRMERAAIEAFCDA